jgi:hypothetical protein
VVVVVGGTVVVVGGAVVVVTRGRAVVDVVVMGTLTLAEAAVGCAGFLVFAPTMPRITKSRTRQATTMAHGRR